MTALEPRHLHVVRDVAPDPRLNEGGGGPAHTWNRVLAVVALAAWTAFWFVVFTQ